MTLTELLNDFQGEKTLPNVRQWLEEPVTVPDNTRLDSVNVMARLSVNDARTVFTTLRTVAAVDQLVAEALEMLRLRGLDFNHASTQAMIDALFEPELASKVKALGEKTVPRWQQTDLSRLKDGYILEVL